MSNTKRYCGRCHTCGTKLKVVLDGEEWCPKCKQYRRYRSHGWAQGEDSPCFEELAQKLRGVISVSSDKKGLLIKTSYPDPPHPDACFLNSSETPEGRIWRWTVKYENFARTKIKCWCGQEYWPWEWPKHTMCAPDAHLEAAYEERFEMDF